MAEAPCCIGAAEGPYPMPEHLLSRGPEHEARSLGDVCWRSLTSHPPPPTAPHSPDAGGQQGGERSAAALTHSCRLPAAHRAGQGRGAAKEAGEVSVSRLALCAVPVCRLINAESSTAEFGESASLRAKGVALGVQMMGGWQTFNLHGGTPPPPAGSRTPGQVAPALQSVDPLIPLSLPIRHNSLGLSPWCFLGASWPIACAPQSRVSILRLEVIACVGSQSRRNSPLSSCAPKAQP